MVHTFKIDDKMIVMDVASGSIHQIDDIAFEIISFFKEKFNKKELFDSFSRKYSKEMLESVFSEIEKLYINNSLYSEDDFKRVYDEKEYINKGVKAICLNIAHDCNLACEYCFASKGDYKVKKELMSSETSKSTLYFLVKNSGDREKLEVDFFGGEPLLNFDVIKKTVAYGKELEKQYNKKINYTITTNGTIMNDEIIDFINNNMDNLVISIDGRPDVHDAMRYYNLHKGSYDTTLKNAKSILAARDEDKSHYIRGTYTKKNLDFSKDVEHLIKEGFKEISIEPVVGSGEDFHLKDDDIENIQLEYEKLTMMILKKRKEGNHINFYHFNANLYGGPCIYKRIAACGAGFEYLAVAPNGKIYPCHQFVGEDDLELGDIRSGIVNNELVSYFQKTNIFSKEDCFGCWAKYFCSGGCHANSYFSNKDIREPEHLSCELQKKRIECAIFLEIQDIG